MNTEAQNIIYHVLSTGEPVGRWRAARAARANPYSAMTVFQVMRCLVPAGERLRNGNGKPEQLFRVDRNRIPLRCSACPYDTKSCDPAWRYISPSLEIEEAPPEDEAA